MRVAANLTLLFTEHPMLDRPARAAEAGFDGVEVLFPYDLPLAEWRMALSLPLALINTPPGDWAAGERGFAAVPGAEARFRAGFLTALDHATALSAEHIHVMTGNAQGARAEATLLENLAWAAAQAPGQSLLLEPLNPVDMPGYFLNGYDQAARIMDILALPNLGLQVDLWHAARLEGDAAAVWARHGARARHLQIAGWPQRQEPGAAQIALLRGIEGYDGWIAAEYRPAAATAAGLGWLGALRAPLAGAETRE